MSMYYIRLALKSFQRTPGLTALMVCAIALGIAVCVMTMTVYHAMSGNPIWWKSDRLFAVRMDDWDPTRPYDPRFPNQPPPQLTYKDAVYLYGSKIPERKTITYEIQAVAQGGGAEQKPMPVLTRATSTDFFTMFEVPFLYGSGWDAGIDQSATPAAVLSKEENEKLFGGANSVGRTIRWNDHEIRVVGVLNNWFPVPRFYDLNNSAFAPPDDIYVPFNWTITLEQTPTGGNTNCWRPQTLNTFQDFLGSDCVWTQMWLELPDSSSRERMHALMDGYWDEQHKSGRFPRPRDNRLTDVGQWLKDQGVVQNDNRMLVGVSFAFLAVCLINTVGILLAKFLNSAAVSGVRRALGASRQQIFTQHLVEVGVLAVVGATFGLVLAGLGLWGVHSMYASAHALGNAAADRGGYQELTHFDLVSVVWAVVLAVLSALAAGLYPAWRIGRVSPAVYLKNQ
jgi:putative ABC transport system permease protein